MEEADVAIIGGGMVGLTMALALAQAGVETVVLDAGAPQTQTDVKFDGRASAIAYASFRMWKSLGITDRLRGDYQRIENILVTDGRPAGGMRPGGPSALRLHFDRRELDETPDGEALGYMLENRAIRRALLEAVAAEPRVKHRTSVKVTGATLDEAAARLTLADGSAISARLAIGAEGRASRLRDSMGVRVLGWKYGQTAIVCTLAHTKPHEGVAHEYFLPSGPFALLPLTGNRTNIVWSEKTRVAEALLKMDDAEFLAELRRRVGDALGDFHVDGQRFAYPLELTLAAHYIAPHAALIGDSAHGVHPIAGQGLNMGLRDVAALAECIADASRLGLDLADHAMLERYQSWRRFDNVALALGMDAMCRLFSNDFTPLRIMRDVGMAAVGRIGIARRLFMREAAGGLGDMPKLLRGESLAA